MNESERTVLIRTPASNINRIQGQAEAKALSVKI